VGEDDISSIIGLQLIQKDVKRGDALGITVAKRLEILLPSILRPIGGRITVQPYLDSRRNLVGEYRGEGEKKAKAYSWLHHVARGKREISDARQDTIKDRISKSVRQPVLEYNLLASFRSWLQRHALSFGQKIHIFSLLFRN
jgi:hypothetical protein